VRSTKAGCNDHYGVRFELRPGKPAEIRPPRSNGEDYRAAAQSAQAGQPTKALQASVWRTTASRNFNWQCFLIM
jgi:hypothetical protein